MVAEEAGRRPLPGSEPRLPAGARPAGPVDPREEIEVTVRVRPRSPLGDAAGIEALGARPVGERRYPSREEFAAAHGADPADLAKVADWARGHGLEVVESRPAERSVVLRGTARAMGDALGCTLGRYEAGGVTFRAPSGPIGLPADLLPIVEAAVGLDDRPHAQPHDHPSK